MSNLSYPPAHPWQNWLNLPHVTTRKQPSHLRARFAASFSIGIVEKRPWLSQAWQGDNVGFLSQLSFTSSYNPEAYVPSSQLSVSLGTEHCTPWPPSWRKALHSSATRPHRMAQNVVHSRPVDTNRTMCTTGWSAGTGSCWTAEGGFRGGQQPNSSHRTLSSHPRLFSWACRRFGWQPTFVIHQHIAEGISASSCQAELVEQPDGQEITLTHGQTIIEGATGETKSDIAMMLPS